MSSIVGGMNAERTNKWLLIGAAVLAVVAGALVFAALANFGGDDEKTGSAPKSGNAAVLVAKQDIEPGTRLTADMFRVATYAEEDVVIEPAANADAIVGFVAQQRILEGQQLSRVYIGQATSQDDLREQLAFLMTQGQRGIGLATDKVTIAGGFVIPGDRVDIVWTVREKDSPDAQVEFLRIETIFQNIEVVARADQPVEGLVLLNDAVAGEGGAAAEIEPRTEEDKSVARRQGEVTPDDDTDYVVLALTPEQTQTLQMAIDLGAITLTLRPFGDEEIRDLTPIRVPVFE